MRRFIPCLFLNLAISSQEPPEEPPVEELPTMSAAQVEFLARIKAGAWLHTPKWRRGDDGMLQVWLLGGEAGDSWLLGGEAGNDEFVSLLGPDLQEGLAQDAFGWLSLWCQGPGDLLGMTDFEFHCGALGIGTSDGELRQQLLKPCSFTGPLGRAELLDRVLIAGELGRRGCKAAVAEMRAIKDRADYPPELRERAAAVLEALSGQPTPIARRRLDAATLALPTKLDLCIVIEHARLPDMRGLAPFARRFGTVTAARYMEPEQDHFALNCSRAQRGADTVAELPFGLAHRFGNYRLDHSCVGVTVALNDSPPFHVTYQAAGAFDAKTRSAAKPIAETERLDNPFLGGSLTVTAETANGTTSDKPGKPKPELAATLLEDTGAAVRVIIPPRSAMVGLLSTVGFPLLRSADLRITFQNGNAALALTVETASEEKAAAWVERGTSLRGDLEAFLASPAGQAFKTDTELAAASQGLLRVKIAQDGSRATARAELPLPGRAGWETFLSAFGPQ